MKNQQNERNKENIQSYFSVFGLSKKTLDISSPGKCVENGQYGQFLSPASKRKFVMSMEHGHQVARGIFSAGKCADGQREVSPKTKNVICPNDRLLLLFPPVLAIVVTEYE